MPDFEMTYQSIDRITHSDGRTSYIMFPSNEGEKCPVLYLIHGSGGVNEWLDCNKGNILSNVNTWFCQKAFRPMIFVMLEVPHRQNGYDEVDFKRYGGEPSEQQKSTVDLDIQFVRSLYQDRMLLDRSNTGIAEFSMGGAGALYYTVQCQRRKSVEFGPVGAFSPSPFLWYPMNIETSWLKNKDDLYIEGRYLYFMGVGTGEGDFEKAVDRYAPIFRGNGTDFLVEKNQYNQHNFPNFNESLRRFLALNIFG